VSWMPTTDPVAGDPRSCDALELVVVPRSRDIGAFRVRRALPFRERQMVGPFIYFDQMGPVQLIGGHGMDVGVHPHIGLATVTYLFEGRVLHRDSGQHVQEITPGALNLMTAGRGMAHSERTPARERAHPHELFGIQSWIALPVQQEESLPSFDHFAAATLPVVEETGWRARVIAGSAFGRTSPVATTFDWFYAELTLDEGASAPLDPDHEDRGVYVAEGELDVAGELFEAPRLLIFRPGDRITLRATRPTRAMLLGGATLEGPRHIWWNFVSSSKERIEQAKDDWRAGRFPAVPDETERIPLPEPPAFS
jgi:redox-sensitive bicupin YhaK (pirin superfamily)